MAVPESMSLRPATLEDLRQILEIESRVHVVPWSEDHFRAELGKPYSHLLVLTDDETDSKVAGYIVFWTLMEEVQVLNVAVDFPFRGLGLAKRMIRAAISLGLKAGAKRALLEVRKSNQAAIQLYQGLSFSITQIRKNFYSNGEDAYQMTLFLEGDSLRF